MSLPLEVRRKYLNSGSINYEYAHCMAVAYIRGQQLIAYGSGHLVAIATNTLNVIQVLHGHKSGVVCAVAWAPFSGRLTSASTEKDILIWEENSTGEWVNVGKINLTEPAICMSWSMCDNQFCVSSNDFIIFRRTQVSDKKSTFQEILRKKLKTKFCSFSRDSRFILTLQKSRKEVIIWHKSSKNNSDYRMIHLYQPSTVSLMRWRSPNQLHERCSFMTLGKDQVVRIWVETGVHETLAFDVVASIPAEYKTVTASFLSFSSRVILNNVPMSSNSNRPNIDTYAYGHGHLPQRDLDYREANDVSERELDRNRTFLVTLSSTDLHVWELNGVTLSVRKAPTLTWLYSISIGSVINVHKTYQLHCVCRLETEFSRLGSSEHIGKPFLINLIIQSKKSKMIESVDIQPKNKKDQVVLLGKMHGHSSSIIQIRISAENPLLLTIDDSGNGLIWKYDDTDIYDPSVLTQFAFTLPKKVLSADWLGSSGKLLTYDEQGFSFYTINLRSKPNYSFDTKNFKLKFGLKSPVIDFRYTIKNDKAGSLFVLLTKDILKVIAFDGVSNISVLKDFSGSFKCGTTAFVTSMLPFEGAPIYFAASSKGEISSVILKSAVDPIEFSLEPICCVNDEIVSIGISQPSYLFVATKSKLCIYWRRNIRNFSYELLQTINIIYTPQLLSCVQSGLFAVASESKLYMYYPVTKGSFPNIVHKWDNIAIGSHPGTSALEWSLEGILITANGTKLCGFTKFMDTWFLKNTYSMYPTIHKTIGDFLKNSYDYHPSVLIPLVISGRYRLFSKMMMFLEKRYGRSECKYFTESLITMPTEDIENYVIDDRVKKCIKSLIEKTKKDVGERFDDQEKRCMLNLLSSYEELSSEEVKAVELKGQAVVKCMKLKINAIVPFDLIIPTVQVFSQGTVVQHLNLQTWEDVENSGIVWWLRDLNTLIRVIVPIAVNYFETRQHLAILLLTVTNRLKILSQKFAKSGADTHACFFLRDFTNIDNKRVAMKNGYSAHQKHNYHVSAALFFLGGDITNVLNTLMKFCNSPTLAYLAARCNDNSPTLLAGASTSKFLSDYLVPLSQEKQDLSCIEYCKYCADTNYSFCLSERFAQAEPRNIHSSSSLYGDMRFVLCELMNTTSDMKADLIKSLLHNSNYFLPVLLLPYIEELNIHECVVELSEFSTTSMMTEIPRSKTIGDLDMNTKSAQFGRQGLGTDVTRSSSKVEIPGAVGATQMTGEDVRPRRKSGPKPSVLSSTKPTVKEALEEYTTDIFGCTNVMDSFDFSDSDGGASSRDDPKPEAANDTAQPLSSDESTAITSNSNYLKIVIVFNVCRYRIEKFIDASDMSNSNEVIHSELLNFSANTALLTPQLIAYLIRSCKRRCYILRRMMLIPDSSSRQKYIHALCLSLALIPAQLLNHSLTNSQVAQIAFTLRSIMTSIKYGLISSEKSPSSFIVASLNMAFFICALFFHNIDLIRFILAGNLRDLCKSPDSVLKKLEVNIVRYPYIPYGRCEVPKYGLLHLLSQESIENLYADGYDKGDKNLQLFGSSLIDLLAFQAFHKGLRDLPQGNLTQSESDAFANLLQVSGKISDTYLTIFQFATLNFVDFLTIKDFQAIKCSNTPGFDELFKMLVDKTDKKGGILKFCLNLLNRYSDTNPHAIAAVVPHFKLQSPKLMWRSRQVSLNCFALSKTGDSIILGTSAKMEKIPCTETSEAEQGSSSDKKDDVLSTPEEESERSQSKNGDEHNKNKDTAKAGEINILPQSKEAHSLSDNQKEPATKPICMATHPNKEYAIVCGEKGSVWAVSFESCEPINFFESSDTPCTAVSISGDGHMFAVSRKESISLYSFSANNSDARPFADYNTWGSGIKCIEFIRGTGLFVLCQKPSNIFSEQISFWDSLLPNHDAMVASIKMDKVIPLCMNYSPKYEQILVGGDDGYIHVVETRMFSVSHKIKAHEKRIRCLKIDPSESFAVTAGNDKKIKVWDMRSCKELSSTQVSLPGVGPTRPVGLEVVNDTIYCGYRNGSVLSTKFR